MSLTAKQHKLLTFIADRIRADGVCPSTTEMMEAIGSRHRGGTHQMVLLLEERGYIRRHPTLKYGCARSIEVLRLPDDVAANWLRTVSIEALRREIDRRLATPTQQAA